MIAHVLLPLPIDRGFDFLVPEKMQAKVAVGRRAKVLFNDKERTGIIVSLAEETAHAGTLEEVLSVFPAPAFSTGALDFAVEVAREYLAPPGLALNRILPLRVSTEKEALFTLGADLKTVVTAMEHLKTRAPRQEAILRALLSAGEPIPKKWLRAELKSIDRPLARLIELGLVKESPVESVEKGKSEFPPNYENLSAWAERLPTAGKVLLFGKRRYEGYLRVLSESLPKDGAALILTPEILASRELHRFLSRYSKEKIALYHSGLPEGKRGLIWEEVRQGKVRIVVGTRSAVFLPFPNLHLVIVDQEENRSYKQDEMLPYYHARDLAERRGTLVILASAAPAVETFHRAIQGELSLIRPPEEKRKLASKCIDMRKEKGPLSMLLLQEISRTLEKGKKAIVMVPRRGYFQAVVCKSCGRPLRCPNCGVNLVYEVKSAQLVCRVCGRAYARFSCPHCGSRALRFVGAGAERVEAELNQAFPDAKTIRIDGEIMRKDPSFDLEHALQSGAAIIVGTPMIAKGPPIPALGLAAAVGVDGLLATPDFRAAERAYQHLVGLAGRLEEGELIVQTRFPDHYAIRSALAGDYELFLSQELEVRKAFSYPPFAHLARILLTARSSAKRRADAEKIEKALNQFGIELLGPSPHPARQGADLILLKAKDLETLRKACQAAKEAASQVEIDINPDRL